MGSSGGSDSKEYACSARDLGLIPGLGRSCGGGHGNPDFLPRESHGQRSLVSCSPWGREESDVTERLHFRFSLFTCMHWRRKGQPTPVYLPGESQGWGAWWATVYGVTQSQTRLKGLSSSSSRSYQRITT